MTRAGRRRTSRADDGFTVIELAVAMAVFGILVALSATGWTRYQSAQAAVSASSELVSVLRNAQMRATAEATTYRVDVNPTTLALTVHRYDGATYVRRTASTLKGRSLKVEEAAFQDKLGVTSSSVYFYPRGTASPGRVVMSRKGSAVQHVVTVEGLTGRVSTT